MMLQQRGHGEVETRDVFFLHHAHRQAQSCRTASKYDKVVIEHHNEKTCTTNVHVFVFQGFTGFIVFEEFAIVWYVSLFPNIFCEHITCRKIHLRVYQDVYDAFYEPT